MQGSVHCEDQNITKFQPSKMAVVVLPQLASTCLNCELRSSNRVKPSRLVLNLPQLQVEVKPGRLGLNMPQPQVEVIQLFTTS